MKFTLACLALLTATSVYAQGAAPGTVTTPVSPMPSPATRPQPVAPTQPGLQPSMQPVAPAGGGNGNSPLADPGRYDPGRAGADAPAAARPHAQKGSRADSGSEPHASVKKTAAAKKAKKAKKAGKKTARADAPDNTLADAGGKAAKPTKSRKRLIPNDGSRP